MTSPAVQLSFTLRTSENVRTVHLLGSWDNYKNQLPLSAVAPSRDNPSVKPGSWRGTFRFQGSHALKLGSRYWYYYIVDGYHVSHDPAKEFVTEPTTGRKLNVLDVPGGNSTTSSAGAKGNAVKPSVAVSTTSARHSTATNTNRHSREVPHGRGLSPGKIVHPKPTKPYASRQIREADYERSPIDHMDELGDELSRMKMGDRHAPPSGTGTNRARYDSSASPSSGSDLSGSSASFSGTYDSGSSSPSSLSSAGSCRCGRYGVTRDGGRVKLDCGGNRCGYTSSECSSEVSSSDSEEEERRARARMPAPKVVERAPRVAEKSRHAPAPSGRSGQQQVSSGRRR